MAPLHASLELSLSCQNPLLAAPGRVAVNSSREAALKGRAVLQEGALVGAVGMKCKVGDCQYELLPPPGPAPTPGPAPGPAPAPAPAPQPPLPPPPVNRISHPEAYALGVVAAILMMFVSTVGFFVRFDKRRAAGCEGLFDFGDDDDDLAAADSAAHELAPLIRFATEMYRTFFHLVPLRCTHTPP